MSHLFKEGTDIRLGEKDQKWKGKSSYPDRSCRSNGVKGQRAKLLVVSMFVILLATVAVGVSIVLKLERHESDQNNRLAILENRIDLCEKAALMQDSTDGIWQGGGISILL